MALAIANKVIWNDSLPYIHHAILNTEMTQVYDVNFENGVVVISVGSKAEEPHLIHDSVTGLGYYLAITNGELWLNDGVGQLAQSFMSTKLEEVRKLLTEDTREDIEDIEDTEDVQDSIIRLNNGWKAIL